METRVISAYTFWNDKQPVYVEVDIVKERENEMIIKTWDNKYKLLVKDSKGVWDPKMDLTSVPPEWE